MKGIATTLATLWRLGSPYFWSEDRWPGRVLLGAVIAIELSMVYILVLVNHWNARFYNALQDRSWDTFVTEIWILLRARCRLHRARRLPALSQSMAADPLARAG